MRLREYAELNGVTYRTAQNWYYNGLIKGAHKIARTIIVPHVSDAYTENVEQDEYVIIYCRVSSSQNKSNLDTQSERLISYCNAKGYKVKEVIKEIGSGVNDRRTKLIKLLNDKKPTRIVIEHKDRLTRFGFNYIEVLLNRLNVDLEIVNNCCDDKEDIIQDFTSIITSFCARIYGYRRTKRKTEQLIKELGNNVTDK